MTDPATQALTNSRATVEIEMVDGGWQPIETAPRDGTEIIVFHPVAGICAAFWPGPGSAWQDGCNTYIGAKSGKSLPSLTSFMDPPTHWMPFPPPLVPAPAPNPAPHPSDWIYPSPAEQARFDAAANQALAAARTRVHSALIDALLAARLFVAIERDIALNSFCASAEGKPHLDECDRLLAQINAALRQAAIAP